MPVHFTFGVRSVKTFCTGASYLNIFSTTSTTFKLLSSFSWKELEVETAKVFLLKLVNVIIVNIFGILSYSFLYFDFRLGLLSMALEPYLKGDVPDIQICTISISYERILEDNLYAYEVLGIPKPKESTSVMTKKIIIIILINSKLPFIKSVLFFFNSIL